MWQTLIEHSESVANIASTFASAFNSSTMGKLIGFCHDWGKTRASFQSYLRRSNGLEDTEVDFGDHSHSGVGACWLWDHANSLGSLAKALAFCVVGHHAGLPDWSGGETPNGSMAVRIDDEQVILNETCVQKWIASHETCWLQSIMPPPFMFRRDDSSLSFWIRMMYSCLVDADFLDTEAFLDATKHEKRIFGKPLSELAPTFFANLDEKQQNSDDSTVNRIRVEIRKACEQTAEFPPGLFSLTVPTGGGKTLSGTAFAFKHALKHHLKRIIYVIPYTSIIEQTADVLRDFVGKENVLEHHSNFDPDKETSHSRLASENWDAPIVVTTAVQFFESLYACKPSRCRKLHNIAESVVILDEVQLLPTHLLLPCAEAIRQLVTHYRTSIILSTATQLNLPGIDSTSVHEIIPPELDLYQRLKRTEIEFPSIRSSRRSWDEIAKELMAYDRVLCVVNTRKDCRDLFAKMPKGTIHLSALMCGEHRSNVIADIKARLASAGAVRVISTQLVEAGVDIDFPVVYRAFTGLSSIAQSAGRCNREGRLDSMGRVIVFMPPKESPRGELLQGEYAMADLLERPSGVNPDDANSFPDYFKALHNRVQDLGTAFKRLLGIPIPTPYQNGTNAESPEPLKYQFREAATAFQMIDSKQSVSVIVRYGDSEKHISSLHMVGPKRETMRHLQRYCVNVPRSTLETLLEKGLVEELRTPQNPELPSGIFIQTISSAYSEVFGLDLLRDGLSPVDTLV